MRFALALTLGCTPAEIPTAAAPSPPADIPEPEPEPEPVPATTPSGDLEIRFLGVGGYLIRYGGDAVLTPPLYTNPDFFETTFGDVASDPERVAQFTDGLSFDDVRAVLVGHAHYDHLLDLPTLWPRLPEARIYGNATVRHILAAFAPDRACSTPAPAVQIPRDRVIQLDDPVGELGRDHVDYRLCRDADPGFDDGVGDWVAVQGANVRFRALCSMHPDQIGPIHFAPGSLEADVCDPPARADEWLEGATLAYLVDFLDPVTGAPLHRIYYQDAPTEVPVGLFAPELLAEKGVDVALLNVGSYPSVDDHPGATLRLIAPRYTIGGHWEDFFRPQDQLLLPILGHDIDAWAADAEAALAESGAEELPVTVDGADSADRHWVPDPGTLFTFRPE